MRLIDADAFRKDLSSIGIKDAYVYALLDSAPTVDAEPIRHGYWIDVNGDGSLWRCSVCGETQCCNSNYCGDCGAKMGEVKE